MTLSLRRQIARGQGSEYLRKNASGRSAHYDELASRESQQATAAQRQELTAMSQSYWQGEPSQEGHNASIDDRVAEQQAQRKTRVMQTLADIYERWYAAGIISRNEPTPQQMLHQLQRDAEQLKAGAKPAQSQPSLADFARDYWRGDNRISTG